MQIAWTAVQTSTYTAALVPLIRGAYSEYTASLFNESSS